MRNTFRHNEVREVTISINGEVVAAKMRHRERQAVSKARDLQRREAREMAREHEYA